MHRLATLALIGAALAAAGCKQLTPPAPASETPVPPPPQAPSQLGAQITISYADLNAQLSQRIPTHVVDETRPLPLGFKADISIDRGPFMIGGRGNALTVGAPLTVTLTVRPGFNCSFSICRKTITFGGEVAAGSALTVNPDWSVSTRTRTAATVDSCDFTFAGFPVPCKSMTSAILGPIAQSIGPMIDQKLADLSIRAQAEKAWTAASTPVQLSPAPPLWLSLAPSAVMLSPLDNSGSALSVTAGLTAQPQLVLGASPRAATSAPLPDITIVPGTSNQFHARLRTTLELSEANAIAAQRLNGKTFDLDGGGSITIDSAAVSSTGARLVLHVAFAAAKSAGASKLKGSLYLVGTPVYDPRTGMLSVQGFDFDSKTSSMLLNAGAWLLHSALRDKLGAALRFDVGQQVAKQQAALNALLAGRDLTPFARLSGSITGLSLLGTYLTDSAIVTDLSADGSAVVTLH